MLHRWFDELMAGLAGDPSDRAYVVDDPLAAGGLVLWEVDGRCRSRCAAAAGSLADTVRMGACYAPGGEAAYVEAAFGAAAVEARRHARHVTVLAATGDEQEEARLAAAGFAAGGDAGAAHGARRELTGPRRSARARPPATERGRRTGERSLAPSRMPSTVSASTDAASVVADQPSSARARGV